MLATQRHEALKLLIEERGSVVVSEVAKQWAVSEMTIRRDLRLLEREGVIARVHGGAVAGGALRWGVRRDRDLREKAIAVRKLLSRIPQRGCIYLDGSTTIFHLIDSLGTHQGLKVATNNTDTFVKLNACKAIEPILIGGNHNRETDNFIGPLARLCLSSLHFEAAFFSSYGIVARLGTVEPSLEDAEIKQLVCERSDMIYIAMNHQKLGRTAPGVWQWPREQTVLATDLQPSDPRLGSYRELFQSIL